MNLTALRRLVIAGNVAALGFTGWAVWSAVQDRPRPRDEKEWPRLFPVKATASADTSTQFPGPKDEYTGAATWPQGDRPVKVEESRVPLPPPPDPFKTKYKLNFLSLGRTMLESCAQLTAPGLEHAFTVRVGDRIPEDPFANRVVPTPWRLDEVRMVEPDPKSNQGITSVAVFHHVDTFEEQTLEAVSAVGADLTAAQADSPAGSSPMEGARDGAGPVSREAPFRGRVIRRPDATGAEWEIGDEEVEWLGLYSDDETKRIATQPAPDGFVLKAVPRGSRAEQVGFKPEDKVIAVNSEKVGSTEQAIAVGKRQYDGGASTFTVKVLRTGKEMNFTFHAPRKKAKK